MVTPATNNAIRKILTDFGYDGHTACVVAAQARRHDLTQADIEAWIVEATTSATIHNPLGFVRARIQGGDKPPSSSASRSTHHDRQRYISQFMCPGCQTWPCLCEWDPNKETVHEYRLRKLMREEKTS